MFSPKAKLSTPIDFKFPFQPYKIQDDLMKSLYSVIENKQIGIYESPTGTGKSLTLTCASICWLLDHQQLVKIEIDSEIDEIKKEIYELDKNGAEKIDWIDSQFNAIQKKNEIFNLKKIKELIEEHQNKIDKIKEKIQAERKTKKYAPLKTEDFNLFEKNTEVHDSELDLIIEDYDGMDEKIVHEVEENPFKDVKIFFCSRTHSQLSQVVREIKRTEYGDKIRCISLASRQNLCINPKVRCLNSINLINEKCLDMQKSQSKTTSADNDGRTQKKSRLKKESLKCPYKNQQNVENLRDESLVEIHDIEDLVKKGENLKACPYYSARESIQDAQVIMLPYQMLLHRKTRIQTGIDLKNSIVIIDEAHNLLDAISNIYSSEINLFQLKTALIQIIAYKTKYFQRFSAKNLLKISQLIFVTKRLIKLFEVKDTKESSRMIKTHELMSEGEFYNINIYHLIEFCENTRFAQKVHGFAQNYNPDDCKIQPEIQKSGTSFLLKKIQEEQNKKTKKPISKIEVQIENVKDNENKMQQIPSVIRPLLTFLESLTECAEDGRVLINYNINEKKASMKFCLLNPGEHFDEIIKDCRSIIIAGGTMQPTAELTNQLFKNYGDRIKLNFYDHVVSKESVLPFVVQKGPTGKNFLFNFTNRLNKQLLNELGMTILNVCNVIPAGIICFVSSYDYLEAIFNHFENEKILEKIALKKEIFRELRSSIENQSIDKILIQYSNAIKNVMKNGAIMFSVVGGKLSEGLNFTDDLGRCVIVIGMPYPNINSPELQQKMKYLDTVLSAGSGNEHYENLCMKAVNQCIGRSVRHIHDYACVLLIDERYASEKIQNKLPAWIRDSLKVSMNFGVMQSGLAKFFRERKSK